MMDDKEILDLYTSGQRERAFKEIVESYSERLYWHVRRFLCSHEDTDDLLQEIFVKIWTALPSFRAAVHLDLQDRHERDPQFPEQAESKGSPPVREPF